MVTSNKKYYKQKWNNNMDSAKTELADKLKSASNILVTVSQNPSVDQLSALLGLALALNKMGKHAAAVFSGEVPSTLEFLQPEETFKKNTDSLRDFIIALDKAKADKLRYKVEDNVVRIFITPYKTAISDADLEFSQGDFNVDVVVALGVKQQEDLDQAITTHGRILHDATVSSINTSADGGLGSIIWYDQHASSLSELTAELIQTIDKELLDEQISTALLTGIVAETHRFSNEKTSSQTMSISAALMAAGANQQLVATKLDEPSTPIRHDDDRKDDDEGEGGSKAPEPDAPPKPEDGAIQISHSDAQPEPEFELPTPQLEPDTEPEPAPEEQSPTEGLSRGSKLMVDAPTLGGTLTANSTPEGLDPSTDPMGLPSDPSNHFLNRGDSRLIQPDPEPAAAPAPEPVTAPAMPAFPDLPSEVPAPTPNPAPAPTLTPPPVDWTPPATTTEPEPEHKEPTLTELEAAIVPSSDQQPTMDVGDARDEVFKALNSSPDTPAPEPIAALNAQPMGGSLHDAPDSTQIGPLLEDILNPQPTTDTPPAQPEVVDPNAPPPVPPPIPFNFGTPGEPPK